MGRALPPGGDAPPLRQKGARELAKLCAEWDIDLVHCHYLREHYTALLAKKYNKKIRVVYTNHFVLANDFVTRFSNRIMDRRQDQMIAVCNKGKEQLVANGWSADRIQVIFNAVDLDAGRETAASPPSAPSWGWTTAASLCCAPPGLPGTRGTSTSSTRSSG